MIAVDPRRIVALSTAPPPPPRRPDPTQQYHDERAEQEDGRRRLEEHRRQLADQREHELLDAERAVRAAARKQGMDAVLLDDVLTAWVATIRRDGLEPRSPEATTLFRELLKKEQAKRPSAEKLAELAREYVSDRDQAIMLATAPLRDEVRRLQGDLQAARSAVNLVVPEKLIGELRIPQPEFHIEPAQLPVQELAEALSKSLGDALVKLPEPKVTVDTNTLARVLAESMTQAVADAVSVAVERTVAPLVAAVTALVSAQQRRPQAWKLKTDADGNITDLIPRPA